MSSTVSPSSSPASSTPAEGLSAFKPRLTYVSYHVADVDRSLAFYVGVLGMKEQLRLDLGKGEHEVVLGLPGSAGIILMWNTERKTPYQLGDGYSRIVINVSDVDAAVQYLAQHDANVVKQPTDAGALRYAMVRDPDGYIVELLQMKR